MHPLTAEPPDAPEQGDARDVKRASIHEAAHAVMAKACGAVVVEVSFSLGGKGTTDRHWHGVPRPWGPEDETREGNRTEGKTWIAGLRAESILDGESLDEFLGRVPSLLYEFSGEDVQGLQECAEASGIDWGDLVRECDADLGRLCAAVEEVAGELRRRVRAPYVIQTRRKGSQVVISSILVEEADRLVSDAIARLAPAPYTGRKGTNGEEEA